MDIPIDTSLRVQLMQKIQPPKPDAKYLIAIFSISLLSIIVLTISSLIVLSLQRIPSLNHLVPR
jgi:hypothetical protein